MLADSAQHPAMHLSSPIWREPHAASTPCAHDDELARGIWVRVPTPVVAVWELRR